jgi:hypothetical protein
MSNIEQVKTQIRFELSHLAEKNAHHDFEHLCRYLARARICSNIIPSTGPVSSGGDQGSDFETFLTYLKKDSTKGSMFLELISEDLIVFACSIQKDEIPNKVKSDVKKILKYNDQVKSIHFFSTSDIPSSQTHKLKKWARDTYSIPLDIHDAQSISELLADRDTFWIATQYLNIPSELFPPSPTKETWYTDYREKWKNAAAQNYNFADFFEIKTALRHAIFTDNVKQDLPFWIEKMEFYRQEKDAIFWRKSTYEICRAKLRGMERLEDEKNNIIYFFSDIPKLNEPVELKDASLLLMYCIGAYDRNIITLTPNQIDEWHEQLISRVELILKKTKSNNYKCVLLDLRGFLSIFPNVTTRSLPDSAIDEAIKWWTALIKKVPKSPLFPLDNFSDNLTGTIRIIGKNSKFSSLTHAVDNLLSKRQGDFIAAQKCKDRALEYHKNGEILTAINELHEAKVKWYSEETLKGSILSILIIAQWYRELNLIYAAKNYALAGAYLASKSSEEQIIQYCPKALIQLSEYNYLEGSWLDCLFFTEIGLKAHFTFSSDASELSETSLLGRVMFYSVTILAVTKQFDEDLFKFVRSKISKWNLDDIIDDVLPISLDAHSKRNLGDLWKELEDALLNKSYGDIEKIRVANWYELGVFWTVNWENTYHDTSVCEQFIAIMQIMLADLADVDLYLLKTNVEITVLIDEVPKPIIRERASNNSRQWGLILPASIPNTKNNTEQFEAEAIAVVTHILFEISLLPQKEFFEKIEQSFKNGLSMKTFVGQLYVTMYQSFIDKELYDEMHSFEKHISRLDRVFEIKDISSLPIHQGLIPNYSEEQSKEFLNNRYTRLIPAIKFTVKRLSKEPQFQDIIKKLRQEGWRDWHILAAIHGVTINYRVHRKITSDMSEEDIQKLYQKFLLKPEKANYSEVPLIEFSEKNLRNSLNMSMLSTFKGLELENHQLTPDFQSVEHFLRVRCNYWKDDIEHKNPFV